MAELFAAGIRRMLRCLPFRLACLFHVLFPALSVFSSWWHKTHSDAVEFLDDPFFSFVLPLGIVLALVCALFLGEEFASGAVRNRLIAGHSRKAVCLSLLFTGCAAALIFCALSFLTGLLLGLPLLDGFRTGPDTLVLYGLGVLLLSQVYAALFTLPALLTDRRTGCAVASLLLALALLTAGGSLNERLHANPSFPLSIDTMDGSTIHMVQSNPEYIPEGPPRQAAQLLYALLPGGQAVQYAWLQVERPGMLLACDLVLFPALAAAGVYLFGHRDLK